MKRWWLWVSVVALAQGVCFAKEKSRSTLDEYLRKVQLSAASVQAPATPGSLWADDSPFAILARDYKASRLGDLVTILVVQDVTAQNSGSVATDRSLKASSGIDSAGPADVSAVQSLLGLHSAATLAGKAQASSTSRLHDLSRMTEFSLLLSNPDFTTAEELARTINHELGRQAAKAKDSRRVDVNVAASGIRTMPTLMARIENLTISVERRAKVVVNERTGTVVMGKDVKLGAVSILHGGISIQITTEYSVSQPQPLSKGQTEVLSQPTVQTTEPPARRIELGEGANVEQLVGGLQAIGATARDVISVLQAIKAAGALEADLEVL